MARIWIAVCLALFGVAAEARAAAPTNWTIEKVAPGIYLKGERDGAQGIAKFMLVCAAKDTFILYAIFDPRGRGAEAIHMPAISLFIDDKSIALDDALLGTPSLTNGLVNAQFVLEPALIQALRKAHTVGLVFQPARSDAVTLGFKDMDFSGGARKLPEFLRTCWPS